MENWTEIRTAASVARLGTVSAAADALGVHRATVTRHINVLEEVLGAKLFQRHGRGFTPTELGYELLRAASETDARFDDLRLSAVRSAQDFSGTLIVTSVDVLAKEILPIIRQFRVRYPRVCVELLTSDSLAKLEFGEAHIAFRAGPKPNAPDYIVQPFRRFEMGLYAHRSYIDLNGIPDPQTNGGDHLFIGPSDLENARAPFFVWMKSHVPRSQIVVKSNDMRVIAEAIMAGCGVGFLPHHIGEKDPNLVSVMPSLESWQVPVWLLTHVDLHHSAKVRAFIALVKQHRAEIEAPENPL